MKKTILPFILLFSVFIALTSCNKEQECNGVVPHYASSLVDNFTDPITPLNGTDTLWFLYNGVDTQIYVGQGIGIGYSIIKKVSPGECDDKYEYLIYNYKCINNPVFSFRMEYHPYAVTLMGTYSDKFYFRNESVGEYMIEPNIGDSVVINKNTYYEPYYRCNGADTSQYFLLSWKKRNLGVYFLKIKYPNHELTLLK